MPTTTTTKTTALESGAITTQTVTVATPDPAVAPAPAVPAAKGHLIYFDGVGGRGEPVSLLLKLAKVDFEYEKFTLAQFADPNSDYHKRRNAGEFSTFAASGGGLPVYKENGKTLFETNAIMRKLGAQHGFYSTNPDTMWEIDVCMEKCEQIFAHAGVGQHSHYVLARINQAAGDGDGPTEEQAATCFAMYEEYANWGQKQLESHGKAFIAGTDTITIADLRYIVQFSDSVYNDAPTSMLGAEMQGRVRAVVDTKPALKKWITGTMDLLKDLFTKDLMW